MHKPMMNSTSLELFYKISREIYNQNRCANNTKQAIGDICNSISTVFNVDFTGYISININGDPEEESPNLAVYSDIFKLIIKDAVFLAASAAENRKVFFSGETYFQKGKNRQLYVCYIPVFSSERVQGILCLGSSEKSALQKYEDQLFLDIGDQLGLFLMLRRQGDDFNVTRYQDALIKLKKSEEQFRFLSDVTFEGIVIHQEGVLLDCNNAFLRMTGHSKEELVGLNIIEVAPNPEDRDKMAENVVKPVATPYVVNGKRKDGSRFIAEIEAKNVNYGDKVVRIAAVRDITERVELQEKIDEGKRKLETLMGNLPGMAYTCLNNPDWDMDYMSAGCVDLLGYTPDELVGNEFLCYKDIIHPDDRQFVWDEIQRAVKENSSFELEYRIITKCGKEKWVWEKGKRVLSAGKEFLEGFINDITFRKNAEKQFQEQEARYRAVFENTGTAVCILESDATISLANERFENLSGYMLADIINKKKWTDFVYVDDLNWMLEQHRLRRADPASALTQYEFRFVDINKQIKHVQISVDMIPGTHKSVASLSDITDRVNFEKQLQDNEQRLSSITSSAQDAIILIDNEGRMIFWNPAAEKMFGYTCDEVMGRSLHNIIAPEKYFPAITANFKHFRHSGQGNVIGKTVELQGVRKDGSIVPVELSLSATKVDDLWGATGIIRDISERKNAEEELQKSHMLLEEKNRLLEEEKAKALESDHLKSAFLATMSHELRTPLNHIIGFSDIMPDMTDDEQIIQFSNLIKKGGLDLLNMIEDIFDLAMIEKTEVKIRTNEVKVRDLYMEVKRELQESLSESGKKDKITLDFSLDKNIIDQKIVTDRPKIMQVLSNLVKNAVKYTLEGSIRLGFSFRDQKYLEVSVKDTGIGIQKELHEKIFEFFRQGDDSHTRIYGGIGLGLAISRKIAHAMKGEIYVESQPGIGSEFVFKVPVDLYIGDDVSENTLSEGQKPIKLTKKIIMVVEDDEISMELMSTILTPMECEILKAMNGEEAIAFFEKGSTPDLIFMDLKMPVMDGFSATKKIKALHPDLPVVALTAYAFTQDKEKALAAGCDDIITKPVKIELIHQKIREYFEL